MSKVIFILISLWVVAPGLSMGQQKPSDYYVSTMKTYTYSGWTIQKGDKVPLFNNDTLTVSEIQKYERSAGNEFVLVGKNIAGKVEYYELQTSLETGKIIPPFKIEIKERTIKAREIPLVDGKILYENIVEVPNITKNIIYDRAKLSYARLFKSANAVIQLDDKEMGHIVGKGYFSIPWGSYWDIIGLHEMKIFFVCEINIKDNKYRIRLYDFTVESCNAGKKWDCRSDDIYRVANSSAKRDVKALNLFNLENLATLSSFESIIKDKSNSNQDDW